MPFERAVLAAAPDDLPPAAPLQMPTQPLSAAPAARAPFGPPNIALRRFMVFAATLITTGAAFYAVFDLFAGKGFQPIEIVGLCLFGPLFVGIAVWFCSTTAGFVLLAINKGDFLDLPNTSPSPSHQRTALLAVIRNEDVDRVFARLRAMDQALAHHGANAAFDFHVLSDTNKPEIAAHEEMAFAFSKSRALSNFYYRRRSQNVGRKAGNVSEWVRASGGAYEYMVVLDADSLMSAELLLKLTALMDRRTDAGLIQTIPAAVGGETLFSRYLQFGMRLYGRVAAAGIAWWSGSESLNWGHNAIARVRAFAQAAGLPRLKGAPPFGGEILSHDVVEGWMMRRAGWGVHMAPTLEGSYEETPPTLLDYATRDRRWCQGNLQHIGLLRAGGLHWINRLQILMGCMVYAAAPLWLAFLAVGVQLRLDQGLPESGEPWFAGRAEQIFQLHWSILLTTVLLIGPKFMGAALIMMREHERNAFGGSGRLLAGLLMETLMSAVLAPILALTTLRAIIGTLIGADAGWGAQRRNADGITLGEATRAYGWQMGTGLVLLGIAGPYYDLVLWMGPILLGLCLAPLHVVITSRPEIGRFFYRAGLMVTPEEDAPPPIVRSAATPYLGAAGMRARAGYVRPAV